MECLAAPRLRSIWNLESILSLPLRPGKSVEQQRERWVVLSSESGSVGRGLVGRIVVGEVEFLDPSVESGP